jgi:hypothetical protein
MVNANKTLLIVLCEVVKFNFMLYYLYDDVLSNENGYWILVDVIILYVFSSSLITFFHIYSL